MKQKHLLYKLPIYCSDILFIYYKDYKYANKILKRYNFETRADSEDKGFCVREEINKEGIGTTAFCLAIREAQDSIENILIHETLHLTQDILEHKGIKFQKKGLNEPYTYLQGWLYQVFLNKITNNKK